MFGIAMLVGILAFLVGGVVGAVLGGYCVSFGLVKKLETHEAILEDDELRWIEREPPQ